MMNLPTISPPKGRMTEAEARVVGVTAQRIPQLRFLRDDCSGGGSLTVATKTGTASQALTREDLVAILSLMIERDQSLLVQFNIDIDPS